MGDEVKYQKKFARKLTPHGLGWDVMSMSKKVLLGNKLNVQIYTESHVSNPHPIECGWRIGFKNQKFFRLGIAWNVHVWTENHVSDPSILLSGSGRGSESQFTKKTFARTKWNIQICIEKIMFTTPNHPLCRGWYEGVNFLVGKNLLIDPNLRESRGLANVTFYKVFGHFFTSYQQLLSEICQGQQSVTMKKRFVFVYKEPIQGGFMNPLGALHIQCRLHKAPRNLAHTEVLHAHILTFWSFFLKNWGSFTKPL